jgi:hypothetical protein
VIRIAVVNRYLFSDLDIAQSKEDDFVAGRAAHVSVGRTGMIDIGGLIASRRSVYGKIITHPDNLRRALSLQASFDATLSAQQFASVSGNLLAPCEGDERKAAPFKNRAFSDFQFI